MVTLLTEKSSSNRQRVIEELGKGRDLATQLQILVENPTGDHGSVSVEELVGKIVRSFTEALSVMNSWESVEVSQIPATAPVGSPRCGDLRFVVSGESISRPAVKDRRGCNKRRKTSSWTRASTTMEDGYAWRKYGQKEVLNAKFPRCYFRCTHKFDRGCQATKQVQRIHEHPIMYQTTYIGYHTCGGPLRAPQYIPDSGFLESYPHYFGSNIPSEQCHPSIDEEYEEEADEDLLSMNSIALPRFMPLESSCWEFSDSFDDGPESCARC